MGYLDVHVDIPFTYQGWKEEDGENEIPITFAVERMVGKKYNDSLLFNSMVGLIKQDKLKEAYSLLREFSSFRLMAMMGIKHWPLTEEDIATLVDDPELKVTVEKSEEVL